MLSSEDVLPVVTMIVGFLVQNYAEWRAGGPRPPRTALSKAILPPVTDRTRGFALVIVSLAAPMVCGVSLIHQTLWPIVAIAAALVLNAIAQLVASIVARERQPGTLAGLVFMLPPSVWVVLTLNRSSDWTPVVLGPLFSVPILIGVWWLADLLRRALGSASD